MNELEEFKLDEDRVERLLQSNAILGRMKILLLENMVPIPRRSYELGEQAGTDTVPAAMRLTVKLVMYIKAYADTCDKQAEISMLLALHTAYLRSAAPDEQTAEARAQELVDRQKRIATQLADYDSEKLVAHSDLVMSAERTTTDEQLMAEFSQLVKERSGE